MREQIKELAQENNIKIKDLLALTPSYDPFYIGSPADHKRAEWASDLFRWVISKWDRRRHQLQQIGVYVGEKPHLRAIHYLLTTGYPDPTRFDGKPYHGTNKDWTSLQDCFKKARILGLVPFGAIADRKHPAVNRYLEREMDDTIVLPTEPIANNTFTFEDLSFSIKNTLKDNLETMAWEENHRSITKRIPVHIEIWTEKRREVVSAIAQEYFVNVQDAVGQQSYENVYSLLQRAHNDSQGKPIRILYLSDFDPRGDMVMTVGVARLLEWFNYMADDFKDMDIKLRKIILTQDQVQEYDLPSAPVKETESMASRWHDKVGEGICEIDSIETLFATEMVDILRTELGRYIPQDILEYFAQYNDQFNSLLTSYNMMLEDNIQAVLNSVSDSLMAQIKPILGKVDQEMEIDMTDELDDLTDHIESFEVPDWEVDDGEDEWLFDSSREYTDQLQHYKEVRGW